MSSTIEIRESLEYLSEQKDLIKLYKKKRNANFSGSNTCMIALNGGGTQTTYRYALDEYVTTQLPYEDPRSKEDKKYDKRFGVESSHISNHLRLSIDSIEEFNERIDRRLSEIDAEQRTIQ
jgi:hypothetical protein